jgi:acetyl esterase/lipase
MDLPSRSNATTVSARYNTHVRTNSYGDDPDQVFDVRGDDGPLALVVHGGFWRSKYARDVMDGFSEAIAEAGFRTANIEYRRLGPGRFRELLDDVAAAARALEPDVAVGHSAGGHLALWLAAEGLVPAAVGLGAVADLGLAARLGIGNHAVRELFGDDFADADPAQRLPVAARQTLVHGTEDDTVPVEIARAFAARAGCTLLELEGADHFDVIDPAYERFDEIIDAVARARPRPR